MPVCYKARLLGSSQGRLEVWHAYLLVFEYLEKYGIFGIPRYFVDFASGLFERPSLLA